MFTYIYIYIYIYICMYVMHINASPYMCTRTCIHAYMHTYIHACMHACIHTQTLSRCLRPLLCVRDLLVELPRRANGLRVMYVGVCVLRVTCVDLLNVWGRRRGFPSISYFWKSPAVPLREPIGDEWWRISSAHPPARCHLVAPCSRTVGFQKFVLQILSQTLGDLDLCVIS